MKERFRVSDLRFLAICLALLAGATWYSVRNFYRAFPEASIDFRVSREDARLLASRFLSDQGYDVRAYQQAARFSFDDEAKTFLEREAGLERANQIMGVRVRLWRWSYRWFRPQQKEEYRVDITPKGELVGFEHLIPEDAAARDSGPALAADQARALAEDFLRSHLRRDPASLEFVEVSQIARPKRLDRVFAWKERDFNLHDAENRVEVTLLGNEIGGYREYLKVPEQWTRDYEKLRSKNNVTEVADTVAMVLLLLGLIVVLVQRVRAKQVRWKLAALIGGVGAALSFLASLNQFPLQEFGFPTTDSYGSFLATSLFQSALVAVAWGLFFFLLTAGAEPLYREAYPGQISLTSLFSVRGLRTKRFFMGSILGISLCAAFFAYQIVFYLLANRLGAWAPAEVPYDDLLNTRFPWLFAMLIGFQAAVFEEFLFRMFAIPFLRKLVRSTAVALVVAGFVWGFGHAGYPNQPFYIRGVEVGIGGVVLGVIMLRWGILPTLVWHYSIDAMYSAMLLLRSHNLYFQFSGAFSAGILALPALVALVAYWRRGGFEPESGLLNTDLSNTLEATPTREPAAVPPELPAAVEYRPLGAILRVAAVAVFLIGMLALLIPTSGLGESPKYRISADQARASADAFLRAQGFNTTGFTNIVIPATHWGGDDSVAGKYMLERRPVSDVSQLFERNRPIHFWLARYFKSLDQEEARVSVDPESGKALGFTHTIPEDRPGEDLPVERAQRIATDFAAAHGWNLASGELKESSSEKKKARRDYTFEWEARPGDPRNVDEARYRLRVMVAGDQVSSFGVYWKIPEAYSRARSRQNSLSIVQTAIRILVPLGAVLYGLWLLIQNIRGGLVRWRGLLWLSGLAALLTIAGSVLSPQLLLNQYNTAIPLEIFKAVMFGSLLLGVLFLFLAFAAALAFLTSSYPDSAAALRTANRRSFGLDAGILALMAVGLAVFFDRLTALLTATFHAQALFSIGDTSILASIAPALTALAGGLPSVLTLASLLALVWLIARKLKKPLRLGLLALFAVALYGSGDIHTSGELALQWGLAMITGACTVSFCLWFVRNNYLAYALILWIMALREPLAQLFGNHTPGLQTQGIIVSAALAASAAWAILPALRRTAAPPEPEGRAAATSRP
ncbi:MAG TPA: type II CAAX endopeptidase family protein [Bryobacteraceae bacterium]